MTGCVRPSAAVRRCAHATFRARAVGPPCRPAGKNSELMLRFRLSDAAQAAASDIRPAGARGRAGGGRRRLRAGRTGHDQHRHGAARARLLGRSRTRWSWASRSAVGCLARPTASAPSGPNARCGRRPAGAAGAQRCARRCARRNRPARRRGGAPGRRARPVRRRTVPAPGLPLLTRSAARRRWSDPSSSPEALASGAHACRALLSASARTNGHEIHCRPRVSVHMGAGSRCTSQSAIGARRRRR